MDLAAFFAGVGPGRVFATLRTAGYPEPVAHLLTGLCTTRATRDDLATMPGGGTDAARDHVRAALAQPHLPQGAPSSPQLANLAALAWTVGSPVWPWLPGRPTPATPTT